MLSSKKNLIVFLCIFLLVVLVISLSCSTAVYTVRSSAVDISKIPLLVLTFLSHEVRSVFLFHKSYWDNLRLLRENEILRALALNSRELEAENSRLHGLLNLKKQASYETLAARVIGKDINSFRPYLILDKGSSDGVKMYASVLTPLGLAGKVLEVGRFSCKIILVSDPDLSIPAVNNRNREQGLVSGSLDGRCKLRFLDIESDVRQGDQIITSGLNMSYPEGILIGVVKFVGVESSGMGKFAFLDPAVKIAGINEVLIVKSFDKNE